MSLDCALREAIDVVRAKLPFHLVAIVLLPDHLHTVWELPDGDTDYSTRWRWIKTEFTRNYASTSPGTDPRSASRRTRGELAVWQRRFYEHTCRDDADVKRCVDYAHVNPLKHGLVERVRDWPWSTFHRYVRNGEYSLDWGRSEHWRDPIFRGFE
ncbi:MAG: transposase [Pirellulales bacterium]